MNIKTIRTNSKNKDFMNLVKELDAYLKVTDEDEHDFYNRFNNLNVLKEVVVTYVSGIAVGCGAIKKFDNSAVEVKRMFVLKENRGTGVAQQLLVALENWAKELGYRKCVLETGIRQIEAVKFYKTGDRKQQEKYAKYIHQAYK